MAGLGFSELLELLGHDGFTSICNKPPGGEFRSRVVPSKQAPAMVASGLAYGDLWFGVNPVKGPARINQGRGTAADVVRLAAVYADLDVKPSGMSSLEASFEVITDLSGMLGTRPVALVFSGHGLQPYWSLEDGPSGGEARALLRRFGRLVAHVAEIHGGSADMIYDLARVLRVPNTTNYKSTPISVGGWVGEGRPLAVGELDEALNLYGAVELVGDRDEGGDQIVSPPATWTWAPQTCHYSIAMMDAWGGDAPAARHPWLLAQATRIEAGHRYGCFDQAGYYGTQGVLVNRFRDLISRGPDARKEAPGEIADAFAWGRDLAGSKTDEQIGNELGNHSHEPPEPGLTWDASSVPPTEAPVDSEGAAPANVSPEDRDFALQVEWMARRLRIQAAARALVAAEEAAALDIPPFDAGTLSEILARPAEPPYRAEGLIPHEAAALIVAMRKTGKTTLNLNLARSLILGEDFLGRFQVRPISGKVGFLNYEVGSAQIARWADEVGIPGDRLCIANLRGRRNPLGNDEDKERLASWLRSHDCESLIVDPFGRAFTGTKQNDPGEVGAWLADLDRWARGEVGVADLILSVHAGWEGERSRGASALEDWGDTIITMTRRKAGEDEEEEDGHRYLRAEGRDVDMDEDQLEYDPMTRLLTLTGSGGRRKASSNQRVEKLIPVVVEYVNSNPACSQRDLESGLPFRKVDVRKAAEMAAFRGLIRRTNLGGKAFSHMPNFGARPGLDLTESNGGDRDTPKSQNVDTLSMVPSLTQAGEGGASHRVPLRPGRTASSASPDSIGGGRGTHPEDACQNPSHSPVIRDGRWTCSDCSKEKE